MFYNLGARIHNVLLSNLIYMITTGMLQIDIMMIKIEKNLVHKNIQHDKD